MELFCEFLKPEEPSDKHSFHRKNWRCHSYITIVILVKVTRNNLTILYRKKKEPCYNVQPKQTE